MARYTEKDKKHKKDQDPQAAAPAGGYAPPPPAAYGDEPLEERFSTLEAEDDGDSCDLRIVVFRGDDPAMAAGAPRIARARVTLTGSSFSQAKTTDGQGEACWTDLAPGEYRVEVAAPKGHRRGGTRSEQVTLIEGEDAVLHIGLEPEEAVLRLLAYHDAQRCGDPGGQTRIKNLRFDVYDGSSLLDSGKTVDDGTAALALHHAGWVEVRMQGRVHTGGTTLLPAGGDRQRVLLEPGKECAVRIAYVTGLAELTVEAVLADGDCEAAPLPGVGLSLYAPGSGVPVRTARSEDWPVVFSDLAAGHYTLRRPAAAAPSGAWGRARGRRPAAEHGGGRAGELHTADAAVPPGPRPGQGVRPRPGLPGRMGRDSACAWCPRTAAPRCGPSPSRGGSSCSPTCRPDPTSWSSPTPRSPTAWATGCSLRAPRRGRRSPSSPEPRSPSSPSCWRRTSTP